MCFAEIPQTGRGETAAGRIRRVREQAYLSTRRKVTVDLGQIPFERGLACDDFSVIGSRDGR